MNAQTRLATTVQLLLLFAAAVTVPLLIVQPLMAQDDEGGGGGGGVSSMWGDDSGGGDSGGRGGQPQARSGSQQAPSPVDRMQAVLTKAGHALTDDQKRSMQAVVDTQRADAQQAGDAQRSAAATQSGGAARTVEGAQGGAGTARPGGGGGGAGAPGGFAQRPGNGPGGANPSGDNATQEKLVALLTPEQQADWKKYQRDEVFARGGYPALLMALEEAGAPPPPEQEVQLQGVFRSFNDERRALRVNGAQPDPVALKKIEDDHLAQIAKLLNTAQRRALIEWRRNSQKTQ